MNPTALPDVAPPATTPGLTTPHVGDEARWKPTPAFIALLAVLGLYVYRYAMFRGGRIGGDGFYSWIFARSLAFDGDIHFANDYAMCGDPWFAGVDEGGGRPANPFYVGPALLWAPVLRIARAVIPLGANPPPAWVHGCDGPWAVATLALGPVVSCVILWAGYRLARRWCSERVAIASMLVIALCSPLLHFGSLIVSYSHVWAAFGAAVAAITWIRAVEQPTSRVRWFVSGVGVGVAAIMRNQAGLLLLSPAIVLGAQLIANLRARRSPMRPVLDGLIVIAGFLSIFWIQLATYKVLYGHYWVVPQGRSYVQLANAQPVPMIFGPRSGLLYWHPLMWLGVLGSIVLVAHKRTRLVGVALVLPLVLDGYVNSAAYWQTGASFGARRLTTLATPFVATGGVFLAFAWRWLRARAWRLPAFAAAGWMLPWVLINLGASSANVDGTIPYDRAVPMPELYGNGLRFGLQGVYDAIGNPFVLPASSIFSLRYGVPLKSFDAVGTGGMFDFAYRPVRLRGNDTIVFADAQIDPWLVEGLTHVPGGLRVRAGQRARFFVELMWGWVTDVNLLARSAGNAPATLRIRCGSFWLRSPLATVAVPARGGMLALRVEPGTFRAGVNEVVLEADHDVVLQRWQFVDRGRHDSSVY